MKMMAELVFKSFGMLLLISRSIHLYRSIILIRIMETITIPKEEYQKLKKLQEVDIDLLHDIASGIKDILTGNIKEI